MSNSLVHQPVQYPDGGQGDAQANPPNPILLVHRLLRGRYPLAITLAVLMAVPGAVVGYFITKPKFESIGTVRIAPTRPELLFETELSRPIPAFDLFVQTQVAELGGDRVLMAATEDPQLRARGWPGGLDGRDLLSRTVDVRAPRRSELIQVVGRHDDRELAALAVNAVLNAYGRIQAERALDEVSDTERRLEQVQQETQQRLRSNQESKRSLEQSQGSFDLAQVLRAKQQQLLQVEQLLMEQRIRLAHLEGSRTAEAQPETPGERAQQPQSEPQAEPEAVARPDASYDPSIAGVLAERDPKLAGLLDRESALKLELASHPTLGAEHRTVRRINSQLSAVRGEIRTRMDSLYQDADLELENLKLDPLEADISAVSGRFSELTRLEEELRARVADLSRTYSQIQNIEARIEADQVLLERTRQRLEALEIERRQGRIGRVEIHSQAVTPTRAARDRRAPLAVMGFGAGAGMGIGLVALAGWFRNGYRYIDELDRPELGARLIGTLPDLDPDDPVGAELAALSVHHLRSVLDVRRRRLTAGSNGKPPAGAVYTITSASSGDGKTSLALSLATSFALAGQRTLIVDADLVGRSLTHELGLEGRSGFSNAVGAETVNGEVHTTGTPNLWAMPEGNAAGFQPERLSSGVMATLFEKLRGGFDAVVVDTGPILGSLEANLAAPASDEVLLVVARGQRPGMLTASLQRLERLGAPCGGLVFNRASLPDFRRSISTASIGDRSLDAGASRGSGRPKKVIEAGV